MKFSLKSSLKALLACAMVLQAGVIGAKAEGEISNIDPMYISNIESTNTGDPHKPMKLIDNNFNHVDGRWETRWQNQDENKMPVILTFNLDNYFEIEKIILHTDENGGAPTEFVALTDEDNVRCIPCIFL